MLSAAALKQVFLVCSRISKKTSVAGVESRTERVAENEVKVKGHLFMTLCHVKDLAFILRRGARGGSLRGVTV